MRIDRLSKLCRCAAVIALAGAPAAHAATPARVVDWNHEEAPTTPPAISATPVRGQLDQLALRPDGTMVVATSSNYTFTNKPPKPSAAVLRLSPLGVQLPSLRLVATSAHANTTKTAVTPGGALVAYATRGKHPRAEAFDMTDAGVASPAQRLSSPGREGWPEAAAASGGAAAVLFVEYRAGPRPAPRFWLAFRAPEATSFTRTRVPERRRGYVYHQVVMGPGGDGAILAYSNDDHSASLWRIGRDGTVGPELPVPLEDASYMDAVLAVGADGTIAATFAFRRRHTDVVAVTQIPAGAQRLASLQWITAASGSSLSVQGVGLAVSPAGVVLAAVEDTGTGTRILEGKGKSFTQTYVPYVSGPTTQVAWMLDGSALVVCSNDDGSYEQPDRHLYAIRQPPGGAFGAPHQIGPDLGGKDLLYLQAVVPAADGSAALAWKVYDGHRDNLFVGRIRP